MIPFECDNLKAYSLLLRIEIALRELLKSALESEFGVQWRKRLPGDLLKKIKESQTEENRPQFGYARLGPLYYLTFGELLTLLQQKSGRPVTLKLGGDCVIKQLENIFVPRNAVCHSRPVSTVGLKTIETVYAEMKSALTADGLSRLIATPDTGISQCEAANELVEFLTSVLSEHANLPLTFVIPKIFQTAANQFWWADEELAGFDTSIVESAFKCLKEYNELPTGVGCAGARQRHCEQHQVKQKLQNAIAQLKKVSA